LWWVGGLVVAALLLVAAWAWWPDRPPQQPAPPPPDPGGAAALPRIVPFTSFPADEFNAAFSPDGGRIAFVWNGEDGGNYDVYVMAIGASTPLRLTRHPDSDVGPAWSPDGRRIVFARYSSRERQLLTVPAEGGSEQVVATVGLGPADPSAPLAWSPDGRFVAYSDRVAPPETHGVFLLDLETQQRRRLTTAPAPGYDTNPRFAPGGRQVAFARRTPTRVEDVYVVPVEGGEPQRLTHDGHSIRGLDWLADGRGVVFASNRSGPFRLWKVPLAGGTPVAVPGPDEQVSGPAVDPRGGRYACTKRVEDRNIWRLEVGGDRPAAATRLIASTRDETMPDVSPRDRSVVFTSNRSGSEEIWRCAADGSGPTPLTTFGGPATGTPRWSPDGRQVAFDSRASGDSAIYVVAADGGPPRRVTDDPGDETTPSWSRDGRWIYFASNRIGEREVWKVPAGGGEPARVTTGGGLAAFESADGGEVYFWRGGERPGIWKQPAAGGPERLVHPDIRPHFWGSWAVGKGGLYFIQEEATADHARKATIRSTVRYFDFASQQVRVLATLEKPTWGLALDPDERRVLFGQFDLRGSDIILVEEGP
jgi:Tol biopolymer transport system component